MVRQVKYLNNIVEQDHHAIKRVTSDLIAKIVITSKSAEGPCVRCLAFKEL